MIWKIGVLVMMGCMNPQHAMALLRSGQYEAGWREFESRLDGRDDHVPYWDGSQIPGKTLLIRGEQGLGDVIQFARYVPVVVERSKARVLFRFDPLLSPMLSRSTAAEFCTAGDIACDFQAFVMSLPHLLKLPEPADAPKPPYIFASDELRKQWAGKLSGFSGLKIGIVWQGGKKYPGNERRSIPLRAFLPLMDIPGVTLFSLQKHDGLNQLHKHCPPIIEVGARLDENEGAFVSTAAILSELDLLISCDTAIVHLAGALNRPVWVALAYKADWRWGMSGETTPWYPSMRLFRQTVAGDWNGVFERIAIELRRFV